MATWSGDRYRGGSSSAYSPLMRQPNEKKALTTRAAIAFVLTVVCPPLGILYMWRAGVFRMRGRVLLTVLGALVMGFIFALATPETEVSPVLPTAKTPQAVTVVSEDESVTALSNIDELLGLAPVQDAQPQDAPVDDGLANAAEAQQIQDEAEAQRQAILNAQVYSVYNGAKYYHTSGTCGTQTNRRQLTVQEALDDGLSACGRCNPPSP